MHELIALIQNNAASMNPVDVTAMRRTLEMSASRRDAIAALPVFGSGLPPVLLGLVALFAADMSNNQRAMARQQVLDCRRALPR